jgi:hypothetical protein
MSNTCNYSEVASDHLTLGLGWYSTYLTVDIYHIESRMLKHIMYFVNLYPDMSGSPITIRDSSFFDKGLTVAKIYMTHIIMQ